MRMRMHMHMRVTGLMHSMRNRQSIVRAASRSETMAHGFEGTLLYKCNVVLVVLQVSYGSALTACPRRH
jgi:hypothetical protein